MSGAFTTVNLSLLPSPNVVETLDYEVILAEMLADLRLRDPAFTATVESDPAYKVLEVAAYRELLLRQRVNDASRAVMLAFASGSDLDQIGANFDVPRLVLDPGNPNAVPPVAPTFESDEDFRARIQLSPEGFTTAGSEGGYVFHGLSADPSIKDVQAVTPAPGQVTVYVLSRNGDGTAPLDVLNKVNDALNAERIRPLTDNVTVMSALVTPFTVTAELIVYPGPDAEVIRIAALDALEAYVDSVRRIGYDVTLSGLYAALHRPGVQRVVLTAPLADIVVDDGEASFCTAKVVTLAVETDV